MIKRLLLLTALVAPALAYGANPSNDFSVQILPSGGGGSGGGGSGGGGGTPTAPAAATAGCTSSNGGGPSNGSCFSTLAANWDFSGATSFGSQPANFYQTLSNWLDCAGASSPQFWNVVGNGGSVASSCSDYSIVTDSSGGDGNINALQILFTVADQNSGSGSTMAQTAEPPRNGGGELFPQQIYIEARIRTTAASGTNASGGLTGDVWSYSGIQLSYAVEWDFAEMYNNNAMNIGVDPGGQALGWGQNGGPGGLNQTQYFTIGQRITANGTNINTCTYVNNIQAQCTGSLTWTGNGSNICNQSGCSTMPLQMLMQSGQEGLGPPAILGTQVIYIEWFRVWTCSSWNSGSLTSRGANCQGAVLGSGQ